MQMELLCQSQSWSSEGATGPGSEHLLGKPEGYTKGRVLHSVAGLI